MDDLIAKLVTHGPIGAALAATIIALGWHIKQDAKAVSNGTDEWDSLEERVRGLENDRVVKSDLIRVYDSIDALRRDTNHGQNEIFKLLAGGRNMPATPPDRP